MTLTHSATDNYAPQDTLAPNLVSSEDEHLPVTRLPKLVWVSAALLSMNLIIGMGMFATPSIQADMYGHEVKSVSAASLKPSPFAEVIDTTKKKVQVAAKLTPVLFEPAPLDAQVGGIEAAASASLDIPRTSAVAYQLDLPVRTQNAVYEMPRAYRTHERDNKVTMIN